MYGSLYAWGFECPVSHVIHCLINKGSTCWVSPEFWTMASRDSVASQIAFRIGGCSRIQSHVLAGLTRTRVAFMKPPLFFFECPSRWAQTCICAISNANFDNLEIERPTLIWSATDSDTHVTLPCWGMNC